MICFPELKRRRAAGWRKYYCILDVLKELSENEHSSFFDSTVVKAMTYGSEVWTTTRVEENMLEVTE